MDSFLFTSKPITIHIIDMTKRTANTDLNHDNWDKEEESEEAGIFQKADEEIIQKRVIRTAKRRVASLASGPGKSSPFSGFSGFGNYDSSSVSSPFSFLSQNKTPPTQTTNKSDQDNSSTKSDSGKEPDKKSQNLEILKDLNLSCNKWITENLEKNPYCILTPIFKDYEKHLSQLELDTELEKKENSFKISMQSVNSEAAKPFVFSKEGTDSEKKDIKEKTFEFKIDKEPPKLQFDGPKNSLTFGGIFPSSNESKINLNVGGNIGGDNAQKDGDEEENEEPPKSDFVPVVEEDSIYDKRCKVFVKKDSSFVSKGVGTLFLKPVKNSKSTQLIVRADTSSGNILLNFLLTSSLPVQKTGKNNVLIVCVPTPESEPPPISVLIKVKTEEDRDEVIKKLEECKAT